MVLCQMSSFVLALGTQRESAFYSKPASVRMMLIHGFLHLPACLRHAPLTSSSFCPVFVFIQYWTNIYIYIYIYIYLTTASQVALLVKNPPTSSGDIREAGLIPEQGRSPGEGHESPLQYSCWENPHGQWSLVGYSPQGCKELDTTELTQHGAFAHTYIHIHTYIILVSFGRKLNITNKS